MKTHGLKDSVFYRLRTKKKLAEVLQINPVALNRLIKQSQLYERRWKLKEAEEWRKTIPPEEIASQYRPIDIPDGKLKRLQSRIADLLMRIAVPVWLFSPVKGRSYVHNAAYHRGGRAFCSLDIADYFSNCTANHVAHYFRTVMQCDPDVVALLLKIVTKDGVLPQGSPCSPILAYFSSMSMWKEIVEIAEGAHLKASVYADDLTLSGDKIPGAVIWQIKKTVRRHGHNLKAEKAMSMIDRAADITGCIINGN